MIRTSALVQGIHVRLFFWTEFYFHLFLLSFQENSIVFQHGNGVYYDIPAAVTANGAHCSYVQERMGWDKARESCIILHVLL